MLVFQQLLLLLLLTSMTVLSQDGSCSASKPCSAGNCCSKFGSCGTTSDYCGGNCASQCPSAKGSCSASKPCSAGYCCSKFGFCGTTTDYCGAGNCTSQCPSSTRTINTRLILAVVIPVSILIIASISGLWWWRMEQARRRTLKYGLQQEFEKHSLKPTFFQYQVLKLATNDFDTSYKLGEGGFGKVYKGVLPNGAHIAVKRLYPSRIQQGTEEFVNEVSIITAVLHRNLVKLHGCCIEEDERILAYEFVENNSLSHILFDPRAPVLDWQRRVEIAVGTARGLAYLHEDCETRIIHRDIKASNILLDKNYHPKIADFGLARLFPEDVSHVSTRIAGTFGYVAPEYGLYGQLTEKADIFSFGVVLLELVTGRKGITLQEDIVLLAEMAWHCFSEGRVLELADQRLKGDFNEAEFRRTVQVGIVCTQANPLRRPRMSHVVTMLLGEREVDDVPTTPSVLSEILGKSYSSSDKSLLSQNSVYGRL